MLDWIKGVVGQNRVSEETVQLLKEHYLAVRQASANAVSRVLTQQVKLHGIEGRVFRDARLDN